MGIFNKKNNDSNDLNDAYENQDLNSQDNDQQLDINETEEQTSDFQDQNDQPNETFQEDYGNQNYQNYDNQNVDDQDYSNVQVNDFDSIVGESSYQTQASDNNYTDFVDPETDYSTQSSYNYQENYSNPNDPAHRGENWDSTENNLEETVAQEKDLRKKLKNELLDRRSYYKYKYRTDKSKMDRNEEETITSSHESVKNIEVKINSINESLVRWFGTNRMSNNVYFDTNRKYFLLNDALTRKPNSQQRDSMRRVRKLFEDSGIITNTVTINYDDTSDVTWDAYKKNDLVNNDSVLINLYNDLQERTVNEPVEPAEIPVDSSYRVEHSVGDNNEKVYDTENKLVMIIQRDTDNRLLVIRHYRDGILISRDIFDINGVNSATQFYDSKNSKRVVRENFYRMDGSLVLVKSYDDDAPYIQLMSKANVLMETFKSDEELIQWWLGNRVLDENSTLLVSSDSPILKSLLSLRKIGVEIIPIVGSIDKNSAAIKDIVSGDSKVGSIIVTDNEMKRYFENSSKKDLDISVIPETELQTDQDIVLPGN